MTDTVTHNAPYFGFLRRRRDFISAHSASDSIEAYVVWGAAMAALSRIHARRKGRSLKLDRRCFTEALHELLPMRGLSRVSIPLLAHELDCANEATLLGTPPFSTYLAAVAQSRIWRAEEDTPYQNVASLASSTKLHRRLFERNRYSEILYEEYRCCAVHGLELGQKTYSLQDASSGPTYMNYIYLSDDQRSKNQRYRTRLCFPIGFLAGLLGEAVDAEEQQSADARFCIPEYPTLDD